MSVVLAQAQAICTPAFSIDVTESMREKARAIAALVKREAEIAAVTGRPFKFVDPDSDHGDTITGEIFTELKFEILGAAFPVEERALRWYTTREYQDAMRRVDQIARHLVDQAKVVD